MGLDITAYGGLKWCDPQPKEESERNAVHLYDTERRAPELPEGFYTFTDTHDFRAGSYSGYNEWRRVLCRALNGVEPDAVWSAGNTGQFKARELIDFSDCEGTIGPASAQRILKDLEEGRERFAAYCREHAGTEADYDIGKYAEWLKALEMASRGGAVKFH